LLEKESLDGPEMRKIAFPDGEPDYLQPKKEEEPFKFEDLAEESAKPADEPTVEGAEEAPAAEAEGKPE
jgi:hypothetical protein